MRYKNYTNEAIYELERQRTMNYGICDDEGRCCENGCGNNTLYDVGGRTLCEDCLIDEVRSEFEKLLRSEDENDNFSVDIIKDIISDFSDSEILTYIENRYDKIS